MTLQKLITQMEAELQDAFVRSILAIRSDVDLQTLVEAVNSGDVERIIQVLRIGPEYLSPLEGAVRTAVAAGGTAAFGDVRKLVGGRGAKAVGTFDTRNEEAERIVRQRSARLVTSVTEKTKAAVRATLAEGITRGSSPRSLALDLVGRTTPGQVGRSGGVIGLTERQAGWIASARQELSSPETMNAYLRRGLRDRRHDRRVRAAIKSGESLTRAEIDRMVGHLADRTLRYRGEVISRTEAMYSVHAGRYEGIRQMESGRVGAGHISSEWDSAGDSDVRDSHADMDGQLRPHGQPFQTPSGYLMLHPGDSSQGAPADETIQCRCVLRTRIDDITGLRERLLG